MLNFDSIYFDSEPLVSSQWPNISVPLKSVFIWARHFEVELFLPIATEMELEEHWYRAFTTMSSDITLNVNKLRRAMRYVNLAIQDQNLPNEIALRDAYRATVNHIKEEWAISSVPLTRRILEEVFGMAIHQSPPFKEEGAGFQDAVIYLSVIDYLRQAGRAGAYVSNDGVFKREQKRILEIAAAAGVRLSIFRTLGDLQTEFERELGEVIGREMAEDRERATESLRTKLDQIGEFISQDIQIPKSHPFVGDLIEIQKIEVVDIEHVLTTYHRQGEQIDISFVAAIKAHVLLDTSPYVFFRSALTANAGSTEGRSLDEQPEMIQHVLKYRVEVEATADSQFEDIEYLSAHIDR